jgi:hypothetical protein
MATASVTGRSAGIVQTAYGSFTGDATATTITLGFTPTSFMVFNETDALKWEKTAGMGATITIKTVTAGTQTADSTTAISWSGGVVTLTAGLAASAKVCSWVAIG